jgi:hypothetical protein
MKFITKLGFAALLTATATTASVAQMYGGLQVGYSMPTASGVFSGSNPTGTAAAGTATSGTATTNVKENIYGTSGTGLSFGLNAGYMFSEHFGFDLGASYNIGSPVVTASQDVASIPAPGIAQATKETFTTSGTQIRLIPSLVVSAGKDGIKPYARFGVVVPVSGETITDYSNVTTVTSPLGSTTYTTKGKTKTDGQLSVGFNTAVGVNIGLGEKMTVFGELALTTLTIKAKSSQTTEYSSDAPGRPKTLADRKFSDNNINYVDKLDNSSNAAGYATTFDDKKATDALALTANYNSLGLNVGIRYKF